MKRHIPGLHQQAQSNDDNLEGLFLVRVERAFYRWHPQKPFFALRLAILEPKEHTGQAISGRLYCTPKALWKLSWFLRDFGYDPTYSAGMRSMRKLCWGCRGSFESPTRHSTVAPS